MSFEEIVEDLSRLTAEEKEHVRQLLESELSWAEAEEHAIEEGWRSIGASLNIQFSLRTEPSGRGDHRALLCGCQRDRRSAQIHLTCPYSPFLG